VIRRFAVDHHGKLVGEVQLAAIGEVLQVFERAPWRVNAGV
jgi:hypothetical protein